MAQTIKLAVIRGDGIGPEVVDEALKVLHAVLPADLVVEETAFSLGAARYLETGDILTDDDMAAVAERYVGAPYLWGGRESLGLDCSGLVQQALFA